MQHANTAFYELTAGEGGPSLPMLISCGYNKRSWDGKHEVQLSGKRTNLLAR
jgi:hypothetical protein